MSEQTTPSATQPRAITWRRFVVRWGGFLFIAALLAVLFFGGARIGESQSFAGNYETWEHGWPFKFLDRVVKGPPSHRFQFTRGEFRWQLDSTKLAYNVAILGGVLGAIVAGRWLLAKRSTAQSAGSFSLASLLIMMTLACLLLGHLAWSISSLRAERAAGKRLADAGHHIDYAYCGPVWITRVFGTNQTPLPLDGAIGLTVRNGTTDEVLRRQGRDLQKLQKLRVLVTLDSRISDDGISFLSKLGTLGQMEHLLLIQTENVTPRSMEVINNIQGLKHLSAEWTGIRRSDCDLLKKRGVECNVIERGE